MICSMLKKGLFGAALGAGALALVFGSSAPSYIKTAFCNARSSVKQNVPIQFEIDRLRGELSNLKGRMASQIEALVREEEDVKALKSELTVARGELQAEKQGLVALREGKPSRGILPAGASSISAEEIAREKARRLDRYNRIEQVVLQKEKTLALRERNINVAHEQLDTLHEKKQELMTRLDAIEAQIKSLAASESSQDCTIDTSALTGIEKSVKDLEKRTDLKIRESELTERYLEIADPVSAAPAPRDVDAEIDAKFSGEAPAAGEHKSL